MKSFIDQEDLKIGKINSSYNVHVSVVREKETNDAPFLKTSEEVFNNFRNLCFLDKEYFLALLLDSRAKLIGLHIVSVGTLNASLVSPREAFKAALNTNSASIIFIHNHPSGNPEPSSEDLMVTVRLYEASKILDIRLLDHIIIGEDSYTSLADEGLIDSTRKLA